MNPIPDKTSDAPKGVICILDDEAAVLEYLALIIRDLQFEARTFQSADRLLSGQINPPDCLIIDRNLNGVDGLDVISQCLERWPESPAILISGQATVPVAVSAMRQGAISVLEKPVSPGMLRQEVLSAMETAGRRSAGKAERRHARELVDKLNESERCILDLIVEGTVNKQIAAKIGLSVRSVENYRACLFAKLNVTSAAEAARLWTLAQPEAS